MPLGSGGKEVGLDELEQLLNSAFDSKISGINAKASSLVKGIDDAKALLLQACDQFDMNEAAPDTEYMRIANTKQIKEQKPLYTAGLRRIIGLERQADAKNLYSSYYSRLSSARSMMDDILKINNKFRPVLEAYANHLSRFRAGFSTMGRYVKELNARLGSRAQDFDEYKRVLEEIEKMKTFDDELASLGKISADMADGKSGDTAEQEKDAEELAKRLSVKMAEINEIDRAIGDVKANIMHILSPLDKAARKYEHGLSSKMYLTHYMEDPVGRLSGSDEAMKEFTKLVSALKKEIEESRIVVKNRIEALQAIEFILRGDMLSFLKEIELLEAKSRPLGREADSIRGLIREIDRAQAGKRKSAMAADEIRGRLERVAAARESATRKTEELLERYYKMQIKIAL